MGQWNDDTYKTFSDLGFTGQLHDMIAAHYREAGYTGSLSDMAAAVRAELGVTDLFPVAFTTTNFITVASDGSVTTLFNNTATTDLNIKDHEDTYRTVPAGVVPFEGARFVENLLTYSEDLQSGNWAAQGTCTIDSATEFTHGSGFNDGVRNFAIKTVKSGTTITTRFKASSPDGGVIRVRTGVNTSTSQTDITLTSTDQVFSVPHTTTADGTTIEFVLVGAGYGASRTVKLTEVQYEITSGRTDTTTPSEYVATTTSSEFKTFFTANGNSVASNVVTEAVGAALSPVPSIFYTPAATNDLTYSRDLTNTWVGTDTSLSYDQVGITGEPNTASVFGDNSATGTGAVRVVQTVNVTSGQDNVFKVWAKKKQLDWLAIIAFAYDADYASYFDLTNGALGATTSADAHEIIDVGNGWYCCMIQFNTTTDVSGQIRLSLADGDADITVDLDGTSDIYIGNIEVHKNKTIEEVRDLGPIFTTTAAASTDRTVYRTDDLSSYSNDKFVIYGKGTPMFSTSEVSGDLSILDMANAPGLLYYDGTNGNLESTDGTNTLAKAHTLTSGTEFEFVIGADSTEGKMYMAIDGSAYTEGDYDGAYVTTANLLELAYSLGYVLKLETLEITQRSLAAGQAWGTERMAA